MPENQTEQENAPVIEGVVNEPVEALKEAEGQGLNAVQGGLVMPNIEGVYLITKMHDGNYVGHTYKSDHLVSVRDISPEIVLQLLLTHDGK